MKNIVPNITGLCRILDMPFLHHMHTFSARQIFGSRHFTVSYRRHLSQSKRLLNKGSEATNKKSTLDEEEVKKFSRLAGRWWDQRGEFAALQTLNELRVPLIRDGLAAQNMRDLEKQPKKPLEGFSILDVGCGGGILTEPLARLGATVTGIDAGFENIEAAKHHATLDPSIRANVTYRCSLVEDLVHLGDTYDGVVASEILEHVSDVKTFLSSCCQLIKPNGSLFITTINRTLLSAGLAVFAAERIFKVVPPGAHDWNKFVTPEELQNIIQSYGMTTRLLHGMILNPITLKWTWTKESPMNYALHAVKSSV